MSTIFPNKCTIVFATTIARRKTVTQVVQHHILFCLEHRRLRLLGSQIPCSCSWRVPMVIVFRIRGGANEDLIMEIMDFDISPEIPVEVVGMDGFC